MRILFSASNQLDDWRRMCLDQHSPTTLVGDDRVELVHVGTVCLAADLGHEALNRPTTTVTNLGSLQHGLYRIKVFCSEQWVQALVQSSSYRTPVCLSCHKGVSLGWLNSSICGQTFVLISKIV